MDVERVVDPVAGPGGVAVPASQGEPKRFSFGARDDLIEHPETVVGGGEPDAHDLPHRLGVQVEASPGCAPVRHAQQHHSGRSRSAPARDRPHAAELGRTPIEQLLRPRGYVLTEHNLGTRTPVGGQLSQRMCLVGH